MSFGRRFAEDLQEASWEEDYFPYTKVKEMIYSYEPLDKENQRNTTHSTKSRGDTIVLKKVVTEFNDFKTRYDSRVKVLERKTNRLVELRKKLAMFVNKYKLELLFTLEDFEMKYLSTLARVRDECDCLIKFHQVNNHALTRLETKYCRQFQATDTVFPQLSYHHLKMTKKRLKKIEHYILVSSSCWHEYFLDCKTGLQKERFNAKLFRNEISYAGKSAPYRLKKFRKISTLSIIDMDRQQTPLTFGNMLLVAVFIVVSTLFATYSLTFTQQKEVFDKKGYFISASIDKAPGANVGTLGLNITLILVGAAIVVRHKVVKKQLRGMRWMVANRIALIVGLLSVFFGMGVAAFRHDDSAFFHNLFACGFFVFSLVYVCIEAFLARNHKLSVSRAEIVATSILFVSLLVSTTLFLCTEGFLIAYCREYVRCLEDDNCTEFEMNSGPSQHCVHRRIMKQFAATFELISFGSLIAWYAMYYIVFRKYHFQLHIHRKPVLGRTKIKRS